MQTAQSRMTTLTAAKGNQFPRPTKPYMIGRVSYASAAVKQKAAAPAMGKISCDYVSCKYGAANLADCCQRIRDLLPLYKGGNKDPTWIRFGALESDRDRDNNPCQPYCAVTYTSKSRITQPWVIKINTILHGILKNVPTMQWSGFVITFLDRSTLTPLPVLSTARHHILVYAAGWWGA